METQSRNWNITSHHSSRIFDLSDTIYQKYYQTISGSHMF